MLTMLLGNRPYATSRYKGWKMSKGRLALKFDCPREVVYIEGADNIEAAKEEVKLMMGEVQRQVMGDGWEDDEDD